MGTRWQETRRGRPKGTPISARSLVSGLMRKFRSSSPIRRSITAAATSSSSNSCTRSSAQTLEHTGQDGGPIQIQGGTSPFENESPLRGRRSTPSALGARRLALSPHHGRAGQWPIGHCLPLRRLTAPRQGIHPRRHHARDSRRHPRLLLERDQRPGQ